MIFFVLTVRDRAANVFGQPFVAVSKGGAIRSFGDEIARVDPNNNLNKHPADFDLYQLGTYDDSTGLFDCGTPQQIAVGKDFAR